MATPGSTVDLTPVTFNGKEVTALSEAIATAAYKNPALTDFWRVVPGIKAKQQVVILGLLGLAGRKKGTDQCAPEPSTEKVTSKQKYWDPEDIEDRFVECWKDLLEQFWVWGLKNGIDKPDLTNTDFANFLEERVTEAIVEGIWRISLFSDKDIDNVADGGNLKNGVDVDYFNPIDGFWKQAYAIVTADANKKVAIAKNAGANYAAQKFTAQDATDEVITGTFEAMVEAADERLTSNPNAAFWVTKSVADQYKKERKKNGYVAEAYQRIEDGMGELYYDGYPIKVLSVQDRLIKTYFNNGTKTDKPHRIAFGVVDDHQLGVETTIDSLSNLEVFYDKKDKQYYIDMLYSLDAMIVEDHMNVFAY